MILQDREIEKIVVSLRLYGERWKGEKNGDRNKRAECFPTGGTIRMGMGSAWTGKMEM